MQKIKLMILAFFVTTSSNLLANGLPERNMAWIYGVSHIGTEAALKMVKRGKEPSPLEKAFAAVLVTGVMSQVASRSSHDDKEVLLNSAAVGAGIVTGITFQMEW